MAAEASVSGRTTECPAHNHRKLTPQDMHTHVQQRIEVDADGVWHIHGYDEARQVLRCDVVKQAGFAAEMVMDSAGKVLKNPPILYLEGEEHHRMRRETNKYFTPSVADKKYREFMHAFADELIGKLQKQRRGNLREYTMQMALRVASQIVGLTNSLIPGVYGRLNGMLNISNQLGENPNYFQLFLSQRHMFSFLMLDVKPAIRARRREPQNDVISYLITRDYSDIEILTECVVYGVAGMATTREFICAAVWHLMENPHLRQRMLVGEQEERYAILHEILRLEPVVGHIMRRTTGVIRVESEGQTFIIPSGALVDMNVFTTNVDQQMAGEDALSVCPMRPLTSAHGKVAEDVISFGDGYHRCPGAFVAIQETDIFVRKLLAIETLRLEGTPTATFNPVVNGFEIGTFNVVID